ncbi:hypothetical protein IPL68_06070 [Candidatus Saccharibacteria bacterium]|nr:MAG: hypothetical protein IPL68_06070 [Candidatus Saccharibacteria bacterium]
MSFTTTIKRLRVNAGASQQTIADAIGIARATYASLRQTGDRLTSMRCRR